MREFLAGLSGRWLAMVLVALAALWAAVGLVCYREFVVAESRAKVQLGNLALAFAEHTNKTIDGADQVVRFVRSEFQDHHGAVNVGDYVGRNDIIDEAYNQLSIIGADGFLIRSSLDPFGHLRIDLGDREHFAWHRDRADDLLHVSKPVMGRLSKKWSIQITRRVNGPEGRFDGVVVVSLAPEYLTRFLDQIDLGSQAVISLTGFDGVVRVRRSGTSDLGGQSVASSPPFLAYRQKRGTSAGTFWAQSSLDGVKRLWAFRELSGKELVVFIAQGEVDVFADAVRLSVLYGGGAALGSLMLVAFAAALARKSWLQEQLLTELRASHAKSVAANEAAGRLLASVSHELRTPLNGILGYAELVRDCAQEPEIREFGETIHTSGQHLYNLVSGVLDLTKLELGQVQVRYEDVDLLRLLEELHQAHEVNAERKGLRLELSFGASCTGIIRSDPVRLEEVLNMLLHNAVHFTARGGVRIEAEGDSRAVTLRVSDTGPGISADRLESLFQQAQTSFDVVTRSGEEAGDGIAVARALTGLIGGEMFIESMPGAGTRISVRLPIVPELPDPGAAA